MLIPLLANRAMLSGDKVSMVTMVCWSLADMFPVLPFVSSEGEAASVEITLLLAMAAFLFRWVLMCLER